MTQILRADPGGCFSDSDLQIALDTLKRGGSVVFPTDTVYGLGVMPYIEAAITRLYEIKGREPDKAIPILIARPEAVDEIAEPVRDYARMWMRAFWPGALTLVFPLKSGFPDTLSLNRTIGVRMPDHAAALQLLQRSGPLAVTSANRSGAASTCRAEDVLEQLNGRFDVLMDGGTTPGGRSSTVVDCTQEAWEILREGPITRTQLLNL
jgi:L-threonylcarbamoyladenylate synthase